MSHHHSLLVLAVACGIAPAAPMLKEKPMAPSIVGEWERTGVARAGGSVVPDTSNHRQNFSADGVWTFSYNGKIGSPLGMTFVVNRTVNPATFDIHSATQGKAEYRGIYKVDGDTLTLCLVADNSDRPTVFENPADKSAFLWIFKRVKAKD